MSNASSESSEKQAPAKGFGGPPRVILWAFGIFLLSQLVAALLVDAGLQIFNVGAKGGIAQSAAAQFFYILLAEGTVVGLVYWILRRRKLKLAAIGLGRRISWRDIKWAVGGFLGFYGLLFAVTAILLLFVPGFDVDAPQDVGFNILATPLDQIIALVALVILPPIGEETLMRGYLYSGLRSRLHFWPALLITSLLFGVAHLSTGVSGPLWAAAVDTFILSAVLVYLREKTGALYAPIMLHGLNNLVAFFAHFYS